MQAPHFLIRDGVESGELELVQSYYRSDNFNVYAYYSHKSYVPAKVRVFLDFIVDELQRITALPFYLVNNENYLRRKLDNAGMWVSGFLLFLKLFEITIPERIVGFAKRD